MILGEFAARRLLEDARVPVVPVREVRSTDEAGMAAEELGYPVVLKLSSTIYSHKTDIGGVILNIGSADVLKHSFREMENLRSRLDKEAVILLEPMVRQGAEMFIGVQRHQIFGPVISAGIGGTWLELFGDVAFRLLPAPRQELSEMLSEVKGWSKLNSGFRDLPPAGEDPLLDLMERLAAHLLTRPEISEVDLNPVIVYAQSAVVIDARIATL